MSIKTRLVDVPLSEFIDQAKESARYFIRRGRDAKGNTINSPSAYLDAAITNAMVRYSKCGGKKIVYFT